MLTFVSKHASIKLVEPTLLVGPKVHAGINCWCAVWYKSQLILWPKQICPFWDCFNSSNVVQGGNFQNYLQTLRFWTLAKITLWMDHALGGPLGPLKLCPSRCSIVAPTTLHLSTTNPTSTLTSLLLWSALYVSLASTSSGRTNLCTQLFSTSADWQNSLGVRPLNHEATVSL